MTRTLRIAALLLFAALASRAALAAGTTYEGLVGWEADGFQQGYAYLAAGALVPAAPHLALPVRLQGSYLYYNFIEAADTTDVRSPGATGMAGVRFHSDRGSLTLLGGGEVRWERRVADTLGSVSVRRTVHGAVLQGEGDLGLTDRWHALGLANYGGATQYVFARGSLRYQCTNLDWKGPTTWFVGLEATRQGNDESDAWGAGTFLECALVRSRLSLSARGGYKEVWSPDSAHRKSVSFGAGLYRRF